MSCHAQDMDETFETLRALHSEREDALRCDPASLRGQGVMMTSSKKKHHLVYTRGTLKQGNSDSIEALLLTKNDSGIVGGYFEIENLSGNLMVFKIDSNQPTKFAVLPTTSGYLEINGKTRVKIVHQGALLTGKERLRVSVLEVAGNSVGKIRDIEGQNLAKVLKEFIDQNSSMLKCFTFNVLKKAGDSNKNGVINGHKASGSFNPQSSTPIESPGSYETEKNDVGKLKDLEVSSVSTFQDGHPRRMIKSNSGTSGEDFCGKLISKGMNDPLESDSMKRNSSSASAVVTDSGSCGSRQTQTSFLASSSSPDEEKGNGDSLIEDIQKERCALKNSIETLEERLESKNVEIQQLNEKLHDLNLEVERANFRLKAKDMEVEQFLGKLEEMKEELESEKQAVIASAKLRMADGNFSGRYRDEILKQSVQKTAEAGTGSTVQCPVTFDVLKSKDVVLFKGDEFGNVFWSSTNLPLEMPNGRRDYTICMKILSRCNPDSSFQFEVCFSPFKDFGVPEGINFGHCFLQLKFLNKLKQPKLCYHFLFDTCNGTCKQHSQYCQCCEATFASGPFVSWGDLRSQDCWFNRVPPKGPQTLELTVEVTVMLMKNSQDPSYLGPSVFADKLDHLISAAKNGDLSHFNKITFSCGRDLETHYNFRELLLFDYSPVFRALVEENMILGPRYGPRVSLRNISNDAMEIFYKYVHGNDDGHWWDNLVVNLELLTFAQGFLIVELSIKCTANLLAMRDESLGLENVLAIIQTGRKYGMKCLEDRGMQWMNEKKRMSSIVA